MNTPINNGEEVGNNIVFASIGCFVVAVAIICGTVSGLFLRIVQQGAEIADNVPTPVVATPTRSAAQDFPTPTPFAGQDSANQAEIPDSLGLELPAQIDQSNPTQAMKASLIRWQSAFYPTNDYFESAQRLGSTDPGKRTRLAPTYNIGDTEEFITDSGVQEATLLAATANIYFWVDSDLRYDSAEMQALAQRFEQDYLPLLENNFGQVWTPGMDGDPHFTVLHLEEFEEGSELGFFDSGDEYPRAINSSSNEQEIIYLNMAAMELGSDLYFGTMVHEVQHLVQWHNDANEETWLDEGLGQLVETMAGLNSVDTFYDWQVDTSVQLNGWNYDDEDAVFAHYGAAYLFTLYFWEQLGDAALRELAQHPQNGMRSARAVLVRYAPGTPLEEFLADWAVALWFDDENAGIPYHFRSKEFSQPEARHTFNSLPDSRTDTISQFGLHYLELNQPGPVTVSFAGDSVVPLLPHSPPSGDHIWFAPPVENIAAQMTANFDLSAVSAATLTFNHWYELEEDWDYVYVTASTDGGNTWELLSADGSTAGQYGPGFNGTLDGWRSESVSLNRFAGQQLLLRFEMLTDGAINLGGYALDNIAIPEIGYSSDAETDDGRWQLDGFMRTTWLLPQTWSVQWAPADTNGDIFELPVNEIGEGRLEVNAGMGEGILIIMPQTEFNSATLDYWIEVR